MNPRTLLIKGKGGLGNRMLSAVCGLVYADLTGRVPVIDWRDGSYAPMGENAYPLLFKTPIQQTCVAFDATSGAVTPVIWAGHLDRTPQAMIDQFAPNSHSNPMGYRRLCVDLTTLSAPEATAVFWAYLPKFGRLRRHLRRDPRFAHKSEAEIIHEYLTRYFTPNDRVLNDVDAITAGFGWPVIGVHIRYTDRKVPLHRIEDRLRQRISERSGAQVFLATDNADVQDRIKDRFENVHHIPKYLAPDGSRLHWPTSEVEKLHEAENALIDMWLLSRCDHLIYSRHSTFSVTSSHLGRLKPAQLDDVDRYSPGVVAKRVIQRYA